LEGDCEIDPSLLPRLEDADGDGETPAVTSRTHGAYALVIFQSPPDMMSALVEAANNARLYNTPTSFSPDFLPSRDASLYLSVADIADKSIEIMEPVTARRMMDNLASERCPKLDVAAGYSSTSGSTANMDVPGGTGVLLSRKPWDSDESADELTPPPPSNGHPRRDDKLTKKTEPEVDVEVEDEQQPQKRHFRFLHKSGKTKDSAKRDSTTTPAASAAAATVPKESNGKHLKRQSKSSSSATASSAKDSLRTSASESLSHSSTAPSLPVGSTAARGASFVDEASAAISNLKIVESPPPANANGLQAGARQLAESDTESDSDAPLGNIMARGAASQAAMAQANNTFQQQQQQQQQMMMMQRASTMGGAGMLGHNQMMAMQQQQPGMVPPMIQHSQSMYGGNMNPQMMQMHPQSMYVQDPSQPMAMQQNMMMAGGGLPMPFQGGARPTTYMDPNGGNLWAQQQQQQQMGMVGMDSVGGPLLTVEKKVDPIERPTGLVGAIANREQMKSEQKYRDSSSLMKERQMRRNQAMGMNTAVFANQHLQQQQMGGARFAGGGGAFPNMYGAPQGWNDDNMSMMSGMSGRAPYAQIAPSLSAEQLAGPYNMRAGTMYGGGAPQMMAAAGAMNGQLGGQFGGQMGMMAAAHDEDDVALSTFANGGGGRMSMALPGDMHPLRAAMQSGMSSSTPHLAGSMN
ncbi:hypothetical protein GGF44_003612, partial [Coemansia sp. RSA 1694]